LEKLRFEAEELRTDDRQAVLESVGSPEAAEERVTRTLHVREADTYYENVAGRLRRSSMHVKEIDIDIIEPRPPR
jgi:hypothetical protein